MRSSVRFLGGGVIDATPVWTNNPSLSSVEGGKPVVLNLLATSPIEAPIVFTAGTLPAGLTLTGSTIGGVVENPAADETKNFDVYVATGILSRKITFSLPVTKSATDDPFSANVVFYYRANGNYTDTSANNRSIVATGANTNMQVVASNGKFGGALEFRGTSMTLAQDMRIPAHADLNVGTSDFTLEWQLRASTTQTQYSVWMVSATGAAGSTNNSDTTNGISIFAQPGNTNRFSLKCGAGGARSTAIAPNDNVWRHYAVVRSGNVIKVYVDGVGQLSYDYTGEVDFGSAYGIRLGNWNGQNAANQFRGFIDEIRLTKAARYLSNFTPPSAEFPYP